MECACPECVIKNKVVNYKPIPNKQIQIIKDNHIYDVTAGYTLNLASSNIVVLLTKSLLYQNIKELDISNNPIKWLPGINTLVKLNCSRCLLDKLPTYYEMPNLLYLNCSDNKIRKIHFPKLKKLECNNCLVDDLQCNSLEYLSCSGNPLTSINIATLQYLEAYNCPLIVIHYIPGLYKRSSIIDNKNNKITHLTNKKEYIDLSYQLINWQNNTCKLDIKFKFGKNILFNKVSKYLFH